MKSVTAVISLVCLIACIQSCNSTKCYECTSTILDGCDRITNDQYLVDCPENLACGSRIFISSTKKIIIRECEPKGTKYSLKTCSSDRCNGDKFVSNVTTYKAGDGIRCYSCLSLPALNYTNLNCEENVNDHYLETCESDEVCIIHKILDAGGKLKSLVRGCGPADMKIISQVHCDEDRCNGKDSIAITKNKHIKQNTFKMLKYILM